MKDKIGPSIQEIEASGLVYRPTYMGPLTSVQIALLGDKGILWGNILRNHASIPNFGVDDDMQGNGFGKRLVRAFTAEAKANGAEELTADLISHTAIGVFTKLFGNEVRLSINGIPCTVEEARAYIPGERRVVHMSVDLTRVNIEGWERLRR